MFDLTPEKQHPLSQYVIAVLIVWAVILAGMWFFNRERFATFAHVCGGFLLGMLAMYIAMHLYRWKLGNEAKRLCAGLGWRGRLDAPSRARRFALAARPLTARTPALGERPYT